MIDIHFIERPLNLDDASAYTDIATAISQHNGTNWSYHSDHIRNEWEEPGFDIHKSSYGLFTEAGQLVAYGILYDNRQIPVHPFLRWGVHPDYLNNNLGTKIFEWVEGRKDNIIGRCPPNTRVSVVSGIKAGYTPAEQTFAEAGYKQFRTSYEMRIDMTEPPKQPQLPEGFYIRTYQHNADLENFVMVFRNSFSDHFGYVEEPFEKDLEEFKHWFSTDKLFDPNFVFLAIDERTDQIAGYTLGFKEDHADSNVSHIHLLGVKRDYRRRGLAKAMLHHAFNAFWDYGQKSVTLGVDGHSLTNAVALYEQAGMRIFHQFARYEKVWREGEEVATVAIAE